VPYVARTGGATVIRDPVHPWSGVLARIGRHGDGAAGSRTDIVAHPGGAHVSLDPGLPHPPFQVRRSSPRLEVDVEDVARVVLGVDEHDVAEEVMHFLDRSGHARVVATVGDVPRFRRAIHELSPEAIVASPRLIEEGRIDGAPRVLILDTRESVAALRTALRVRADGFFVWPTDRGELAAAIADIARPPLEASGEDGLIVAVYSPRGGAGTTFVATHLAAAVARRKRECILLDLDRFFGDVGTALGVPSDEPARTIADLVALGNEVAGEHLDRVLWHHADGFRVLLAPPVEERSRVTPDCFRVALGVASRSADVVVGHVPRALDEPAIVGLQRADRVLLVVSLDVLSFRSADRALSVLRELDLEERCEFVVNRAARAELAPHDVRRAFGRPAVAVIPSDRGVAQAQDHGRLVSRRGGAARSIERLADALLETVV
jgi:Flp pilus assembly CpaE family ATPase